MREIRLKINEALMRLPTFWSRFSRKERVLGSIVFILCYFVFLDFLVLSPYEKAKKQYLSTVEQAQKEINILEAERKSLEEQSMKDRESVLSKKRQLLLDEQKRLAELLLSNHQIATDGIGILISKLQRSLPQELQIQIKALGRGEGNKEQMPEGVDKMWLQVHLIGSWDGIVKAQSILYDTPYLGQVGDIELGYDEKLHYAKWTFEVFLIDKKRLLSLAYQK